MLGSLLLLTLQLKTASMPAVIVAFRGSMPSKTCESSERNSQYNVDMRSVQNEIKMAIILLNGAITVNSELKCGIYRAEFVEYLTSEIRIVIHAKIFQIEHRFRSKTNREHLDKKVRSIYASHTSLILLID